MSTDEECADKDDSKVTDERGCDSEDEDDLVYDVATLRGEEDYDGEEEADEGEGGDVVYETTLVSLRADYSY